MTRIYRPIGLSVAGIALLLLATFAAFGPARAAHADEPVQVAFALKPNLVISNSYFVTNFSGTYLIFSVKNTGLANAGPFSTSVESFNGAWLQEYQSAGLAAGQSVTYTHKLPACVPYGQLSRTIVADSGNLVNESNEGDNEVTKGYVYGPSC